jgi:hypothetical protein
MILRFLDSLNWIDGNPLVVQPYRRRLHEAAWSVDETGRRRYSMVLAGRAKKNDKSLDLVLEGLAHLLLCASPQGSDCYILANDEDQAGDDLDLAAKLVRANPHLDAELVIRAKSIERRDGRGALTILPARDVAGSHGKTGVYIGYDEIHPYRDYSLLEALSPDPTRPDVLTWICSYDSLFHVEGRPLWDMFKRGREGGDPRMLFQWYSGNYCTDPEFADLPPEQRANPSMGSWTNPDYLDEQRKRLPSARFRRLHLNLGGAPEGAFFSQEKIEAAVVRGRKALPFAENTRYVAYIDMSGGSNDDACCAIAHVDAAGRAVLDVVMNQGQRVPFDPRQAVKRFVPVLRRYGVTRVRGDAYAGRTFVADFEREGITYEVNSKSASDGYEALEPHLNAGEVELLDVPTLVEQMAGLVWRGGKVDHERQEHDDWVCAATGAVLLALPTLRRSRPNVLIPADGAASARPPAEGFVRVPEERPERGWHFAGFSERRRRGSGWEW